MVRRFNLLLSQSDWDKLGALADAEQVKSSQIVRSLIRHAYAASTKIDPKRIKP